MSSAARLSDPGTRWDVADPERLATAIRLRAVRMVAAHGFGYLGQALSSAEQVAALFSVARPGADRIVCSPGHYVIAFYAAAAEVGLISERGAGQLRSGRLGAGSDRHRAVAAIRLRGRIARPGPVGGRRAGPFRPAARSPGAHLRPDQRRRAGRGPGVGGGDVRRASAPDGPDRPGGRQQLAGRRAGRHDHDHRAGRGEMGVVRLAAGRARRSRRARRVGRAGRRAGREPGRWH